MESVGKGDRCWGPGSPEVLQALPYMEQLGDYYSAHHEDEDVACVHTAHRLIGVEISQSSITDNALIHPANLPHSETLIIDSPKLNGTGFRPSNTSSTYHVLPGVGWSPVTTSEEDGH